MKRLVIIISILGLIGCGTYEDEVSYLSKSTNLIFLKQKINHNKKISPSQIGELLKKVEVSVSENESDLFKENLSNEFSINSVMDIYIGARFSYYSGIHNIGINIYLPDGSLYRKSAAEIDFGIEGNYSMNNIIIDNSDSGLIAKYILPIAGTELSIFNLVGSYNVEISIDNVVVANMSFILK